MMVLLLEVIILKTKNIFHRTWVIIALSILMVFTVLGFCSYAKSLYMVAICDALNLSRSAYSFNDSCRYIATSVISIFFGSLIVRFGMKKMIMAGFASLILSNFLYSIATNIWMIYLGGILLGVGMAWTTTTMAGAITAKFCKRNRGTITGIILASNGVGGALAVQVLSPFIYDETNIFGYRDAYRLVCVILTVVALVIFLFFHDKVDDRAPDTKETDSKKTKKSRGRVWAGVAYQDALKTKYFYGSLICVFLTGTMLQGVVGIAAPHLQDAGLSASAIATIFSISSILLTVCKISVGVIYDRGGIRLTTNLCFVAAIAAMFLLAAANNSSIGLLCAYVYAFVAQLALPLETVMLPIYASEFFGEKSNTKMLGIFTSVNTAGFALGSPIANICFDVLGSYKPVLYGAGILMILVTVGMQFVIFAAEKQKRLIENTEVA